ncbi:hypothetical protein [Azospirillum aestuarii]|uniref:hypothetical protein n=1 Tax=Azospirillum aestuarii TaxID=2802052 RepID=UPI004054B08A
MEKKTLLFQMRASPEFLTGIDNWRRHQDDIPARAEAIRRLVDRGMLLKPLVDHLWQLVHEGIIAREVFDNVLANAGVKLDDFDDDE